MEGFGLEVGPQEDRVESEAAGDPVGVRHGQPAGSGVPADGPGPDPADGGEAFVGHEAVEVLSGRRGGSGLFHDAPERVERELPFLGFACGHGCDGRPNGGCVSNRG